MPAAGSSACREASSRAAPSSALHGSSASTHDTITRSQGSFQQTITGLLNIQAFNIRTELRIVVSKLNEDVVSDPVPMVTSDNKDAFRLVMVKKKYPAHRANIEEDYWRIQTWALNQKNQQVIQDWIRKKAKNAFIRIDEDFADCGFQFDWQSK